tara:strand:- start:33845 stop:34408 length:564 start_codon:yes stop_codon:yes gene_type:complete
MIMAKNRINKVYTKFGDAGNTMLVSGEIVSKDSIRVESYGDIDELNSFIGLALTDKISARGKRILNKIQNDLFILGADLASTKDIKVPRITKTKIGWIEKEIDKLVDIVGPLKEFILPAGCFTGTCLHLSRVVCRRAERKMVTLSKDEWINSKAQIYVNRLSDLLFVLARHENISVGEGEVPVNFKK